ncbi:MAG: hypothetical protein ACMXYG_05290 [Candidatus Woesearchaeota archaeon]
MANYMKYLIILMLSFIFILGCNSIQNNDLEVGYEITSINNLLLDEKDLVELDISILNSDCEVNVYETSPTSPLEQDYMCYFNINSYDSEVIIQIQKFTNLDDLNGTYQYSSSHYRSAEGLISENEYGDMSRFYRNSEKDYGAEFNDPDVYFYHLWIVKDKYLILVTSKGSEEAKDTVEAIGLTILSKFE